MKLLGSSQMRAKRADTFAASMIPISSATKVTMQPEACQVRKAVYPAAAKRGGAGNTAAPAAHRLLRS